MAQISLRAKWIIAIVAAAIIVLTAVALIIVIAVRSNVKPPSSPPPPGGGSGGGGGGGDDPPTTGTLQYSAASNNWSGQANFVTAGPSYMFGGQGGQTLSNGGSLTADIMYQWGIKPGDIPIIGVQLCTTQPGYPAAFSTFTVNNSGSCDLVVFT